MLTQVLTLLERHRGGLGVQDISRRLDIQPGAVAGMLELLVSKGRLIKVTPADQPCGACPLQAECRLLAADQPRYVFARSCAGQSR
jgi:hypothetical protein